MKDFRVTPEILDLFRNEKVQARTVKKLIPDYIEYRIEKHQLIDSKYLDASGNKLYNYLTGSHWATAQEFLGGIQSILEFEGLLKRDSSQEIFHFDGTSLDEGYGYYQISETMEKTFVETEADLLERICQEIRQAKKKEKLESKNIGITTAMLNEIANNPILMNKLLELKGN